MAVCICSCIKSTYGVFWKYANKTWNKVQHRLCADGEDDDVQGAELDHIQAQEMPSTDLLLQINSVCNWDEIDVEDDCDEITQPRVFVPVTNKSVPVTNIDPGELGVNITEKTSSVVKEDPDDIKVPSNASNPRSAFCIFQTPRRTPANLHSVYRRPRSFIYMLAAEGDMATDGERTSSDHEQPKPG